jgi:hypothetical protein
MTENSVKRIYESCEVETQTEVHTETTGRGHKTGLNRAEKWPYRLLGRTW